MNRREMLGVMGVSAAGLALGSRAAFAQDRKPEQKPAGGQHD